MRASLFWLVVVPFLLMTGGAWNGWLKPTLEEVKFSRAQVDLVTLQRSPGSNTSPLSGARPDMKEILGGTSFSPGTDGIRDPWGNAYRAVMVLDGSGRLAVFSAGPDGRSCLSERSGDDIFPGSDSNAWTAALPYVGWYRGAALLAAGFLFSQVVVRSMGAFRRPAAMD